MMTAHMTDIRVGILKKKRKVPEPRYSKKALEIFLWLDDSVMSAWLQSARALPLEGERQSAQIPKSERIPFVEAKYFSGGDYSDWTTSSGQLSYETDDLIAAILHGNNLSGKRAAKINETV